MPASIDVRLRAIEIAQSIIGGRTRLIRGVRELSKLSGTLCPDPLSPTLLPILVAADETRDLALDPDVTDTTLADRKALIASIEAAEHVHREPVLSACRRLVAKLLTPR